jgi:hypothetical protein
MTKKESSADYNQGMAEDIIRSYAIFNKPPKMSVVVNWMPDQILSDQV